MSIDGQRAIPAVQLNTGKTIPQLGFGIFLIEKRETERAVSDALEVGYRHFDTAQAYGNERELGRAISGSGLRREQVFVTSKLWNTHHGRQAAMTAIDQTLDQLGFDYLDLYLIHWPVPAAGRYIETWLALEEIAASGKARAIGVSNFMVEHLRAVMDVGSVVPAVNQVELHPAFQQRALAEWCRPRGIVIGAWAPLGHGSYNLMDIDGLASIAARHGKSVQQVVIRWHLQRGHVVFPKTVRKERMAENIAVFDFELSDNEMAVIDQAEAGSRIGSDPMTKV
jgi:2,5-diketo-D-gluconate reductase A